MMMFKRIFDRIVSLLLLLLLFRPIIIVGAKELWEIDGVTYLTPDDIDLNSNNSSNYRQNMCDEYKYMIDNNLDVKDALNGAKLNVLIVSDEEEGYFDYNDKDGATGIYANIIEYIAKSANFTMNVTYTSYPTPDMNMTHTEQLVWGLENYDIFVADWERSSERINLGVNFVDEFYDSSYIIVRSIDDDENDKTKVVWTNWLAPFTMAVWFVLLATIICSSFVHQFLEHLRKNAYDRSDNDNNSTSKNISTKATIDNIYLSFLNFTQQFSYEPSSLSGKIFSISFVFWSMLIGAAYTANLASLLVERSTGGLVINTIQDAIDNKMNICVHGSSNMDEYFTKVYPESIPFMVKANYRGELYDMLNDNQCDIAIGAKQHYETIIMKEEYNPDCKLQWNGRKIKEVGGSFATKSDPGIKCTSLIAEVFNFYTNKMITDGYLEELWNTHEAREATRDTSCYGNIIDNVDIDVRRRRNLNGKANTNSHHRSLSSISASGSIEDNSDDIDAEPLNLNQMAGTFLLHVVGSIISIIVGLLSFWNKKRRRNKKKARQGQVEVNTTKDDQEYPYSVEEEEEVNTIKDDQAYPYSVEENDCGSRRSQLQQFEELTKRMDDIHNTMLALMATTKRKET